MAMDEIELWRLIDEGDTALKEALQATRERVAAARWATLVDRIIDAAKNRRAVRLKPEDTLLLLANLYNASNG